MKHFMHILISFAFLMGVIAPACGFSWGGKYSVIEICTSEGIESRVINNAQESPLNTPDHEAKDQCPFCVQNANIKLALFTASALDQTRLSHERLDHRFYNSITLKYGRQPQTRRGPPLLV